jgi:hypothetical protein
VAEEQLFGRVVDAATAEAWTLMSLRNRGEPAGFSKLMAPFLASAMRRANRSHLAKLASILETR